MSQFLNDTFTDTSGDAIDTQHTGEVGATWTKHSSYTGSGIISDANRARANSAALVNYYASGIPDNADYDVVIDLRCVDTTASTAGPAGRISTSANDCYFIRHLAGTGWELRKIVAGTISLLTSGGATALTASTTYVVKLQMRGTTIEMYVDAVLVGSSITDSAISAAGRAGIRLGGALSNTTGSHCDRVYADDMKQTVAASVGTATTAGLAAAVSAGSGVSASVGTATSASAASVVSSGSTIGGAVGTATSASPASSVAAGSTIGGSVGTASAGAFAALVSGSGSATVDGAVGTASTAGIAAALSAGSTISGSVGTASTTGVAAGIAADSTIGGSVGTATADGIAGVAGVGATIAGSLGTASAAAIGASLSAGSTIVASVGTATAAALAAVASSGVSIETSTTLITTAISAYGDLALPSGFFDGVTVGGGIG